MIQFTVIIQRAEAIANMMEKVYVAIGNDVQEGLATLEWTLRRWSSSELSIVILHADINRDYVYTYCKFITGLGFQF